MGRRIRSPRRLALLIYRELLAAPETQERLGRGGDALLIYAELARRAFVAAESYLAQSDAISEQGQPPRADVLSRLAPGDTAPRQRLARPDHPGPSWP